MSDVIWEAKGLVESMESMLSLVHLWPAYLCIHACIVYVPEQKDLSNEFILCGWRKMFDVERKLQRFLPDRGWELVENV